MRVFAEEHEIAPVRVILEFLQSSVHRTQAIAVTQKKLLQQTGESTVQRGTLSATAIEVLTPPILQNEAVREV